jgi:hypothetical protein
MCGCRGPDSAGTIEENPHQTRNHFGPEAPEELANQSDQRRGAAGGGGLCRWTLAADLSWRCAHRKLAGKTTIPAIAAGPHQQAAEMTTEKPAAARPELNRAGSASSGLTVISD